MRCLAVFALTAVIRSAGSATATANICGTNASIGQAVIGALNLSWPGLAGVASAAGRGDLQVACEALAAYYRNSSSGAWVRLRQPPAPSDRRAGGNADDLVDRDIFHLSGVGQVARVPRNADGGFDWLDEGPKDDPEFMNCLNRHQSFTDLLSAAERRLLAWAGSSWC